MIFPFFGNPSQIGILATLLAIFGLGMRVYLIKRPDMARADNEARTIDNEARIIGNEETARQYREWRKEIHDLKTDIMKLMGRQTELEKLLTHALSTSSMRRDQMDNMMGLIELLIAELERLDKNSIIVPQAKALLKQMRDTAASSSNIMKSNALSTAEDALSDAKQTVFSTGQAVDEINASEGN